MPPPAVIWLFHKCRHSEWTFTFLHVTHKLSLKVILKQRTASLVSRSVYFFRFFRILSITIWPTFYFHQRRFCSWGELLLLLFFANTLPPILLCKIGNWLKFFVRLRLFFLCLYWWLARFLLKVPWSRRKWLYFVWPPGTQILIFHFWRGIVKWLPGQISFYIQTVLVWSTIQGYMVNLASLLQFFWWHSSGGICRSCPASTLWSSFLSFFVFFFSFYQPNRSSSSCLLPCPKFARTRLG